MVRLSIEALPLFEYAAFAGHVLTHGAEFWSRKTLARSVALAAAEDVFVTIAHKISFIDGGRRYRWLELA